MIGLIFLLVLTGITFGPAAFVLLMPAPFWRTVAGWSFLALGLIWLGERNIPFGRLGMLGDIGTGWTQFVGSTLIIAIIIRVFRSYGADVAPPAGWWLDWDPPLAGLTACFAFHWLANRMAGYEPAKLPHISIVGLCLAVMAALLWTLPGPRLRMEVRPLLFAFCLTLGALVLHAGYTARVRYDLARTKAEGRPFCLVTYAGRDQPRQAVSWWSLSPLVSRSGGRSYVDDRVDWLLVSDSAPSHDPPRVGRSGKTAYIVRSIPERSGFDAKGRTICKPTYGGGLNGA